MSDIKAKRVLGAQLGPCHQIDLGAIGDVVIGGKPARNVLTALGEDEQSDQVIAEMLVTFLTYVRDAKLDTEGLMAGNYEMVKRAG